MNSENSYSAEIDIYMTAICKHALAYHQGKREFPFYTSIERGRGRERECMQSVNVLKLLSHSHSARPNGPAQAVISEDEDDCYKEFQICAFENFSIVCNNKLTPSSDYDEA